jgi:hypothetical protein
VGDLLRECAAQAQEFLRTLVPIGVWSRGIVGVDAWATGGHGIVLYRHVTKLPYSTAQMSSFP